MLSKCCSRQTHKQNGVYFCKNCCAICQVKSRQKLWVLCLFVLTLIGFAIRADAPDAKKQHIWKYLIEIIRAQDVELNDTCILLELRNRGAILPVMGIAQAHIETTAPDTNGLYAPYQSRICLECHNIFGIRFRVKNSKSIGETKDKWHYLIYNSYKDCISDYVAIQNKYLGNIDGHYAEDGKYVTTIKSMKK